MKRLLLVTPALLAVVALAGAVGLPDFASADESAPATDVVVVTGEGAAEAVPDEASFSFGVETRGATAKAALAANAETLRHVLEALRAAGARDIATEYVSVWPRSEDGSISGYSASNSVSASIAVGRAGDLVDAATAGGANVVSGPGLSRSDADGVYRKALAAAVADAHARAETLARAAGRTLGGISKISEGGEAPIPYYERAALAGDASTPIVPGKQETQATISVTFELR